MNKSIKFKFKISYMLIYLIPVYLFLLILLILSLINLDFAISIGILILIYVGLTFYLRWILYFDNNKIVTFYLFEGIKHIKYENVLKVYIDNKKLGAGQYIFWIDYKIKNKKKRAKFEFGGKRKYLLTVLNFINLNVKKDVIDNKSFEAIKIKKQNEKYIDLNEKQLCTTINKPNARQVAHIEQKCGFEHRKNFADFCFYLCKSFATFVA